MFSNLKIGARLGIGFGAVIILLGGIVLVAQQSLAALNGATAQIVDDRYPQVVLATNLLLQLNENAIAMRNMLLADNPDMLRKETEAIAAGDQAIAEGLRKLSAMLSSDSGRKAYQDIMVLRTKYQAEQARFVKLAGTGGTVDAAELLMTTLRGDQLAYAARMKAFLAGGGKLMEKSGRDAAELYQQKRLHILALAVAAFVLAVGFGRWITRSITRPLDEAVQVARTIASGDLSSEIVARSRDEVGELMQALKDMNGDLCRIVREVRGGTDAIAGAASEIAQGNMDLSARTEQQASALEETASALEELTATVSQNAELARGARVSAQEASAIATNSSTVVEQVVQTVAEIGASSHQIADITSVINSIAFQTNILALNASVEAARAGEHGRGFAVVAAEVRILAQRSATAAHDIKLLIEASRTSVGNGGRLARRCIMWLPAWSTWPARSARSRPPAPSRAAAWARSTKRCCRWTPPPSRMPRWWSRPRRPRRRCRTARPGWRSSSAPSGSTLTPAASSRCWRRRHSAWPAKPCKGAPMEEVRVSTWNDFMSLSGELDGWAFRGQQDARWLLLSSLSRYLNAYVPDKASWRSREERAIRIFRRKAHNYLGDPSVLDNALRCLALMQHHGAPTRLLDFTKSPFVAAFFGLERATGDAAVYALNTPQLWVAAPLGQPDMDRNSIDPRQPGNFSRLFLPNTNAVIWTGEPTEMDRRLVAQSGTVVVPGVLDKPLDEVLQDYGEHGTLLKKIVLPLSLREEAMKSLYRMNITNATLFPDLDGLARSIGMELEMVWAGAADPTSGADV
jgi:methyl-accepting chemotaxis protein